MTTLPAWGDLLGNTVLPVAAAVLFAFIYFAKSRRNAIQYFFLALLAILLSGGIRSLERPQTFRGHERVGLFDASLTPRFQQARNQDEYGGTEMRWSCTMWQRLAITAPDPQAIGYLKTRRA